jgi:hypothetical protein
MKRILGFFAVAVLFFVSQGYGAAGQLDSGWTASTPIATYDWALLKSGATVTRVTGTVAANICTKVALAGGWEYGLLVHDSIGIADDSVTFTCKPYSYDGSTLTDISYTLGKHSNASSGTWAFMKIPIGTKFAGNFVDIIMTRTNATNKTKNIDWSIWKRRTVHWTTPR